MAASGPPLLSDGLRFEVTAACPGTAARRGQLRAPRGSVETPAFMPVGTQGAIKALDPRDLRCLDAGILLANTYHLYLRPGADLIAAAGGLHRFMNWDGLILTDSGGFQVFSLGPLCRLDDQGVTFRSHIDGSEHRFTPEGVVALQGRFGSDMAMCLDVCTPHDADSDYIARATALTAAWARRSAAAWRALPVGARPLSLFAIVQGGDDVALRRVQARELRDLGFGGYAIGSLSVGEPRDVMYRVLEATTPELPADRPRYLMGVGSPDALLRAVALGVDLFDCVLPTRLARHGTLITHDGRLNLLNAAYRRDLTPPDPNCTCYTCRHYTRAYLRHLFKAREVAGLLLATHHNLHVLLDLMRRIRRALDAGEFAELRQRLEQQPMFLAESWERDQSNGNE